MQTEVLKTFPTFVAKVDDSRQLLLLGVTVSNTNINGEVVNIGDSHISLALGNVKASLESYGVTVEACACVGTYPTITLNDGEVARMVVNGRVEKLVSDAVESEQPAEDEVAAPETEAETGSAA